MPLQRQEEAMFAGLFVVCSFSCSLCPCCL